jgi:GntR family transcriptional regulator/MocR family aminotransferase
VVSGARQALFLAAHVLLNPGETVWFEDPGYPAARAAISGRGLGIVPVPIDSQGFDVDTALRIAPDARAAYVTPSHQFPTGILMNLRRRLQLLDWAAQRNAWIFEDDYDSEFCYDKRPLPALQGLDEHQSVVYVGTLNKVMYPGLRVGYLVAPSAVVGPMRAAAAAMSLAPPDVVQRALADYISDGHLARHINQMRTVYKRRQEILIDELQRRLPKHTTVVSSPRGTHIRVMLPDISAQAVAELGARRALDLRLLSSYAERHTGEDGIVMGYTHLEPEAIRAAVRELALIVCAAREGTAR